MTTTPEFAPFGFFTHYATVDADLLRTVESLGFDTAWLGGSPPADLPWIDPLLSATERIRIVTAIVNIWSAPAQQAAQSWQRVQQEHPGRFILGIGAGHPEIDSGVAYKPYSGLVEYLDVLDQAGVPQEGRALAALAEKSLKLAAQRSALAHPYLTPPSHTRWARELLGPDAVIVPEQKVVLTTDADEARTLGRQALDLYLGLTNYLTMLERFAGSTDDLVKPGSDKLVDTLIAYGTPEQIAARLQEHRDAGATQVAIQVLGDPADRAKTLGVLARELGL
ncbi:TIGR03620 family F420-dependent LLM class oxidoreductase [Mycobacteroides abscessus subsp. abscessus]|uniref:TIGR03620 family F420-dependent LLM class oxidoreductase n=1 Tax=Mycobacteroides abscessus TaxID=36809 RepID=UPI000666E330|nr:TIGR03620 family F420-dependent LLM class oxidoreductase [Mycobacteroides abscessus]AKP59200.1 F420-dependent oxidoreductase [Mycobacteroides abscessus UC22]AWG50266.1 TIGR03620 family F420-dependent LLM class oxidoreductase [Mycobacteroides abscessus]MDM2171290.1 TIGR03620 family F420-dependent LLM class oxidoreductase [Mycobacteroides abscessus]MDM2179509.1 TIGR03620 family F420-dependent LLM class oxidoreductase [Mycobacteroides abscessus]MDM2208953.1 TIGR03620 family F420-dependent LLM 